MAESVHDCALGKDSKPWSLLRLRGNGLAAVRSSDSSHFFSPFKTEASDSESITQTLRGGFQVSIQILHGERRLCILQEISEARIELPSRREKSSIISR